jgi:hypothetical protein
MRGTHDGPGSAVRGDSDTLEPISLRNCESHRDAPPATRPVHAARRDPIMFAQFFSYVADRSMPGLGEAEARRLAANDGAPRGAISGELRDLDRRQLRDLGLDRSAA